MAFVKKEHFEAINKSKLTLSQPSKRTRTGAWNGKNRKHAHGKFHKHQ